jgi:hypothetical protein
MRQSAADGSGEDNHLASYNRPLQIGFRAIDRAASFGYVKYGASVAADDLAREAGLLQSQAERASDKAGADDRDLVDGHRGLVPPAEAGSG